MLWYTVYPPVATLPKLPHMVVAARFSRDTGVGEAAAVATSTALTRTEESFILEGLVFDAELL